MTAVSKETKKQNRRRFNAPQSQDFTISDDVGVVGHLRVKPNGVAWKGKSQQKFDQITIEQLAEFAAKHGRKVNS